MREEREEFASAAWVSEAARQLTEYFAGERKVFTVELAPQGTEFQKAVWQKISEIPYGETRTYGEIAASLGKPNASRAVGAACGKNPLMILIPCHRVVGAGGKLTGYAYGLEMKRKLLELEKNYGDNETSGRLRRHVRPDS